MGALLKAFKTARDNNSQTGAAACVVPFMEQMEDLFGDRPMLSSNHTIGISRGKHTTQSESPEPRSRSPEPKLIHKKGNLCCQTRIYRCLLRSLHHTQ